MIEDAQVWTEEELRWLREGIIEECARVAENHLCPQSDDTMWGLGYKIARNEAAAAIRALRQK